MQLGHAEELCLDCNSEWVKQMELKDKAADKTEQIRGPQSMQSYAQDLGAKDGTVHLQGMSSGSQEQDN